MRDLDSDRDGTRNDERDHQDGDRGAVRRDPAPPFAWLGILQRSPISAGELPAGPLTRETQRLSPRGA
jgi:hypothetical protein